MTHNPVGWFEIYVTDLDRSEAFYEAVLGVAIEPLESPDPSAEMRTFPMTEETTPGAGGALVKMADAPIGPGGTMVYFSCEDCAAEAGRVEGAGGNVVQPKFSIGPYGFCAIASDPDGNVFGLHSRA